MILNVRPTPALKGSIYLPASKSYSIRAHFIAACGGASKIIAASDCDDAVVADTVGKKLKAKAAVFNVGESGTSLRFLLPLLAVNGKPAIVKGKGTLVGRPNNHLCEALRRQGMDIRGSGPKESVPIIYKGGALKSGTIHIDGSVSSQFISALLIAAPCLDGKVNIAVDGKTMVSADYIVMTRQILALAGIKVKGEGKQISIPYPQKYRGLKNFHVPSDYGLAAFPMAAAALVPSNVTFKGHFNDALVQSDGHILPFMKRMGIKFKKTAAGITMKGPFQLKGGTFSLKTCPDLVPIMSVLALFAKGQTTLVDIGHARVKESDRISDVRKELLKVGADVRETKDSLIINPKPLYKEGQTLDPHHDHRLAMAFTVLGLRIGCRVLDIECTAKSYPRFVKDMKALGIV